MNLSQKQAIKALDGIEVDLLIPIYLELYERTVFENASDKARQKGIEIMRDVISSATDYEKKQLIANMIVEKPDILLKISEDLDRAVMGNQLLELKNLLE